MQSTGTTFTMLWDTGFQSWNQLGITGQPAWMLLNRFGQIIDEGRGGIPESRLLEEIGA